MGRRRPGVFKLVVSAAGAGIGRLLAGHKGGVEREEEFAGRRPGFGAWVREKRECVRFRMLSESRTSGLVTCVSHQDNRSTTPPTRDDPPDCDEVLFDGLVGRLAPTKLSPQRDVALRSTRGLKRSDELLATSRSHKFGDGLIVFGDRGDVIVLVRRG